MSLTPPLKIIITFSATKPIFENVWKQFENNLKNFNKREKMRLGQVDVSHTAKNVGYPAQNVDHTMHNACEKCLYF